MKAPFPSVFSLAIAAAFVSTSCSNLGYGVEGAVGGTADEIRFDGAVEQAFVRADAAIDAIVALPAGERTFENTPGAVDDAIARVFAETRWTGFMGNVHPDAEVRAAGDEAREMLSNWFTELFLREDLYEAVSEYAATEPRLEGERARLLSEYLRDFRRAGMELGEEQRGRLKEIELELNDLEQQFDNNIRDDESYIAATKDELLGLSEDQLARLPRSNDLYIVPTKGALAVPVFRYCEVPSTRQRMGLAYGRRAGLKNVSLLEKLIALRNEKAQLLGYPTTAHYETEIRMSKDPETVMAFYEELRPKLRAKAEQDLAEYTAAKREHTGDPQAELHGWDVSFYGNWLKQEKYAVDSRKVQEYFPLQSVYDGLFSITQDLFEIEYRDVTDRAAERGRPAWHEDVRLYEVWDERTGRMLGEFYTDLHPRPNKYNHAAQFPLVLRKKWGDGSISTPVVALVCNFTKPTEEKPALLTHGEVETFFHEFGHCLHSILTEAELANFAGTGVARDFVEAPSQMLENWIWDKDVLKTFARHYETGEPIPDALVDGMVAAKNLGTGMSTEGQVYLGMMDMRFHTDPDGEVDTTEVCHATYRDCRLFEPLPESYSQASFGHMTGYQAGYYGYLWSLVYAQDMFQRFEEHGLLNPEAGRYYREKILSKGGTVDALELVRGYLGREPSSDAFLEHLGLTANL